MQLKGKLGSRVLFKGNPIYRAASNCRFKITNSLFEVTFALKHCEFINLFWVRFHCVKTTSKKTVKGNWSLIGFRVFMSLSYSQCATKLNTPNIFHYMSRLCHSGNSALWPLPPLNAIMYYHHRKSSENGFQYIQQAVIKQHLPVIPYWKPVLKFHKSNTWISSLIIAKLSEKRHKLIVVECILLWIYLMNFPCSKRYEWAF